MGPLDGVRVVELAGIGPGPFCGLVLAGLGAEVVRIDRVRPEGLDLPDPVTGRSRLSLALDLKNAEAVEAVLRLVERSSALIEGFRPGVMERLGLGPEPCHARNPRLVYGRVTGWGQEGPLSASAGHDITYLATTGVLHAIGRADEPPVPPLNLVADYGGGGMLLAVGVLAALIAADRSGQGQVVDAAMVDGAALLSSMFHGALAAGWWTARRGINLLDGGAPFYGTYMTADGEALALGALEPQFFAELVQRLGLDPAEVPPQHDRARWQALRQQLAGVIASRTRAEWAELLEGTDACAAAVMSLTEAPDHPHLRARGTFVEVDGVVQPAPAPRFSATPLGAPVSPPEVGRDTEVVLTELGYTNDEIGSLRRAGAIG